MKDRSSVIQVQRIQEAISNLLEAIGEDPRRQGFATDAGTSGPHVPGTVLRNRVGTQDRPLMRCSRRRARTQWCYGIFPSTRFASIICFPSLGWLIWPTYPTAKWPGLSKLARALEVAAHRLQVQERLTSQVADAISHTLKPIWSGGGTGSRAPLHVHAGDTKAGQ